MHHVVRKLAATALLAAGVPLATTAQVSDAPRAPRILPNPQAPPSPQAAPEPSAGSQPPLAPLRPPSATRLAPLPDERNGAIDEIVVIGQGWRLPDLGSEWRARQAEAAESGRFSATALPLYDPARPPWRAERTLADPEERRHGYIELFRLRFGRRTREGE